MTRPRKKRVHCWKLAAVKKASKVSESVIAEPQSSSENDNKVLILDDSEILEDYNDEELEKLLVWKEGSSLPARAAYTGDSRWTNSRRDVKKRLQNDAKSLPKIWTFFPRNNSVNSLESPEMTFENLQAPSESLILESLEKLNQQINLTPNIVKKNRIEEFINRT